jgi:hypothetical protein
MKKEEKEKKENELDYIYNQAETEGGNIEPNGLLMESDEISEDFEPSDIDYDDELQSSYDESKEIIENMSELYLDSNEEILSNKYIKNKVLTDAQNLADMFFLQKIAKRAITKQMQQIDAGEGTPRHYETLYNGMKEIRENIKQSTVTTSTMEGFYKQMREDLGLKDRLDSDVSEALEEGNITTTRDLNDKLNDIIKSQKK